MASKLYPQWDAEQRAKDASQSRELATARARIAELEKALADIADARCPLGGSGHTFSDGLQERARAALGRKL